MPYDSLYGLPALPTGALSPSVAGLGFGVGVGTGYADGDIGGGVAYGLGQIDPIMPADVNDIGGFATLTTPIMLLYRMLLASALANIGASLTVVMSHGVATRGIGVGFTIVGAEGVGNGNALIPYRLRVAARFRLGLVTLLPEIHVLVSLLP